MPVRIVGLFCLLIVTNSLVAQQILPGTWSNRTGEGGTVSNPPSGGVSTFYDMTTWDSSPYQEFRLHKNNDTPNGANFWLNFRLLYPIPYSVNPQQKYPLIVMLHGLGEAGVRGAAGYTPYTADDPRYLNNDHQLYHNGLQHLTAVETGEFPGFVLVPQNITSWTDDNLDGVITMIEKLIEEYPIDQYRIYLHGYSNGADGVWRLAEKRPDLFAAMTPMSWINLAVDRSRFLHIPIWYFQGELDENPLASSAQFMMTLLEQEGASPRYTEYINGGHAIWYKGYAEPDYFSWMLGIDKTDIMAYYGRTSVCPNEDVNVRLGVSPGFQSYQWRRTTPGGTETFTAGGPDNNEYIAQQTGDYQVRMSRKANPGSGDWSPWSDPLSINVQENITPPSIALDGSPHLPSPDGRTSAKLSIPDEYESYQWFRNGSLVSNSNAATLNASEQGNYHVNVTLAETCPAISSDTVLITKNAPVSQVAKPGNLKARAFSEVALELTWVDASNNETGFELYRSGASGGPYKLVKYIDANTTVYKDSALIPSTTYFYKLRAFNENFPSAISNTASATTLADNTAPTVPGFLSFQLLDAETVMLNWYASTDNSNLIIYDIIVNGKVVGSTTSLNYQLNNLNQQSIYTIFVRARDRAGNMSDTSNQVTVITVFEGLSYKYYSGGLWEETNDYNGWPVEKQGYLENISIETESEGGVRPDLQVNYFAFDFYGYLYIKNAGKYTFSLEAAAGSVLKAGGFILDNDGRHPAETVTGSVQLKKGAIPLQVKYYDRTEEEVLKIYYSGPDTNNELILIPDEALISSEKQFPAPPEAPDDFRTTDIQLRQINLAWEDQSSNETGFEVFRAPSPDEPYVKIKTTNRNQTAFQDKSLAPLHTYQFLVRAVGNTGTSGFDSLTATTGLPLAELNAECQVTGNMITWTSAYPWEGEPFIVERSADKIESFAVGVLDPDTLGASFEWLDNAYSSDTTWYRIGQRSPQGGIGYSGWVQSHCLPVNFSLHAEIYPVPVTNGYLTIRMKTLLPDQQVHIVIMDNIGRIMLDTSLDPDPLSSPYTIDVSAFRGTGLYIVSIRQGGETYQQKIIVEN